MSNRTQHCVLLERDGVINLRGAYVASEAQSEPEEEVAGSLYKAALRLIHRVTPAMQAALQKVWLALDSTFRHDPPASKHSRGTLA